LNKRKHIAINFCSPATCTYKTKGIESTRSHKYKLRAHALTSHHNSHSQQKATGMSAHKLDAIKALLYFFSSFSYA